jgi:hypothetical protein
MVHTCKPSTREAVAGRLKDYKFKDSLGYIGNFVKRNKNK